MKSGTPLRDQDRWPWLERIGRPLADEAQWPRGLVIACSALRRAYRDRIRAGAPGVRFVFLDGPAEVIRSPAWPARSGHYMPESLLASQLQTLEAARAGRDRRACASASSCRFRRLIDAAVRALGR
jgi:gluconokinase